MRRKDNMASASILRIAQPQNHEFVAADGAKGTLINSPDRFRSRQDGLQSPSYSLYKNVRGT
jgi:hypothetical protein